MSFVTLTVCTCITYVRLCVILCNCHVISHTNVTLYHMLCNCHNPCCVITESRVILLPAIVKQLSHLFFMQDDMANQILGDILLQLHAEEKVWLVVHAWLGKRETTAVCAESCVTHLDLIHSLKFIIK